MEKKWTFPCKIRVLSYMFFAYFPKKAKKHYVTECFSHIMLFYTNGIFVLLMPLDYSFYWEFLNI